MQALFYGIGAAVIGIIVISAYKRARSTNKRDPLLWGIFAVLLALTVVTQSELAIAFILAGLLVLLAKAPPLWIKARVPFLVVVPWFAVVPATPLALGVSGGLLLTIFLFFVKAGSFVFGSGLAIVPFLYEGVVRQHGWLTEQQFRDAVAVAMITPGPVVITVAFIGYLVAGFAGAVVAAAGIFLPVYVLTIIPAPWVRRHRDQPQVKAFAQGATAAATGAIAGAVLVLGYRAIVDVPTALIALASLAILWRYKPPEPLVVAMAGAIGLAIWVLTRGVGA
jgi:chromate transporter